VTKKVTTKMKKSQKACRCI